MSTITYQHQDGIQEAGVAPAPLRRVRATIPALEALRAAGALTTQLGTTAEGAPLWDLDLDGIERMPAGLIACRLIGPDCSVGIRTAEEPEYPQECGISPWVQANLTPCPVCGAPLVWYEAGYVPGWRVCARPPHHHCLAR